MTKVERRRTGIRYIVSAIAGFDLAAPSRLDSEQTLWTMLPQVLPSGAAVDGFMPKPRAELLIGGRLNAPQSDALMLQADVGGISRRLVVYGDRWWKEGPQGYMPTPPQPIVDLLLEPARAFGGPLHPVNPVGAGHPAQNLVSKGAPVPLPNIEEPGALIHSILDLPLPARFGPLDFLAPERRALAGTYDQAWAENVAPALPDDVHPDFFMQAPPEQRFADYLRGDEPYRVRNFSPDQVEITGSLPAVLPRVFVGRGTESWVELTMRLDTLWLFAGARRGVLVWHGMTNVEDIDGKDVTDVLLGYERMADPPRPVSHYAEVRRVRTDPDLAPRYAFAEYQLSPPRDPAEDALRRAARVELSRKRVAAHAEVMEYFTKRELERSGVPPELQPPLPSMPDIVLPPLPTPEDLAEGDFDLGELLDAMEEMERESQKNLEELSKSGQDIEAAMDAVAQPGATTSAVDAMLAAMAPLAEMDIAAELDKGLSALQPRPLTGDGPMTPEIAAVMGEAVAQADWRSQILQKFQDNVDDEALLREAYGRFLDAPEFRPLAEARKSLRETPDMPAVERPPDMPALAPPPDAPPAPPSNSAISNLLDQLAGDETVPAAALSETAQKLAAADKAIVEQFPNLKPAPGGSAIDALLTVMAGGNALQPEIRTPEEIRARMEEQAASFEQLIDESEARLKEGLAAIRLDSPSPAYPEQMLAPHVAKRFGDMVLADVRAGMDLRGRDLAGVDLAGANLSGLDLSGAFLERANLANARFVGANLRKVAFTGARLAGADLSDADLSEANLSAVDGSSLNLSRARLDRTNLTQSQLRGAVAKGAVWIGVSPLEADFSGADLSAGRFDDVKFIKVDMRSVRLDQAFLRECQMIQGDLSGAVLDGAVLDRCSLLAIKAAALKAVRSDLRGSTFVGEVDLSRSDFTGALASDCGFHGANLVDARFSRAVLDRAIMGEAKLSGARFRLASMQGVLLDASDMEGADLVGAHLLDAKLRRVNLTGATLRGANLYGVDLTDADLSAADLSGANLAKTVMALETRNV